MIRNSSLPLLVLAGGFGTRLRSVVSDVPKPLAPIDDKPFLECLIENWYEQGVREFIFLLHYRADLIERFLGRLRGKQKYELASFVSLTELKPLGTGGAVAHAVQELNLEGRFLVANADTWISHGIAEIVNSSGSAIGVVKVKNVDRYGVVIMENGVVKSFQEKKAGLSESWINSGIYILEASDFRNWNGESYSIEREQFPELIKHGRLGAVRLDTDFIDIGVPQEYRRFCEWMKGEGADAL